MPEMLVGPWEPQTGSCVVDCDICAERLSLNCVRES